MYKSDSKWPSGLNTRVTPSLFALEFIVGAEQERLLSVPVGANGAVGAAGGLRRPLLQSGLLRVLLVGGGEVVDGILDHVPGVHGLL